MQMYDPKTKQITTIDTCFGTGPPELRRQRRAVVIGRPAGVEGWFDTKIWDKTHDEKKAQGWTAFVLDTNGNGKRDAYTEPESAGRSDEGQADQRAVLRRVAGPLDGSVWGSVQGMPGALVRLVPGLESAGDGAVGDLRSAVEQPEGAGSGLRAARHGRRQQRRRLDGALERSARELRSPQVQGPAQRSDGDRDSTAPKAGRSIRCRVRTTRAPSISAAPTRAYYNFVDRFDMLGVGKDVPLATGNESEALLALVDGKFLTFRVPYPMGFYAKGIDGRIDDPNGGWKGKGIYTTFATRAPFHAEGGKGTTSKLVKFQVRPDPLAK